MAFWDQTRVDQTHASDAAGRRLSLKVTAAISLVRFAKHPATVAGGLNCNRWHLMPATTTQPKARFRIGIT